MNDETMNLNRQKKEKAIKDLMEDLNLFGVTTDENPEIAEESLDLLINQTLAGVDIRSHFPDFYKRLLRNKNLRQQFLDAIALFTSEQQSPRDPYLQPGNLDLSFLKKNRGSVAFWPIFLTQSKSYLMNIFFPVELNYRAGVNPGATPVYSILRRDFDLAGTTYTILIDGTLSEENTDALSVNLSLTTYENSERSPFPVQASLRWGEYSTDISLDRQGTQKLPDILLSQVFDADLSKVKADLFLTLSSAVH
ncbi:MAG: hypothetical protein AB9897_00130 [Anaerolineaceae bacterium]